MILVASTPFISGMFKSIKIISGSSFVVLRKSNSFLPFSVSKEILKLGSRSKIKRIPLLKSCSSSAITILIFSIFGYYITIKILKPLPIPCSILYFAFNKETLLSMFFKLILFLIFKLFE